MEGNLPVIVAVDGSVDSERALRWGREAARLQAAPLHVVHVWPYATAERAAAGEAGGDPVLARLRDEWEGAEGEPGPVFRSIGGLPDSTLPALGAEARMLVLGSRGRGGFASLLLGSNGLAAAGQAACTVVIVPRPDRGGGRRADGERLGLGGPQITLGVDAEEGQPGAIGFAFAEASRRGARLKVISGYTWPLLMPPAFEYLAAYEATQQEYEDALAGQLTKVLDPYRRHHPETEVEVELRGADAAGLLVDASLESDLVVVARHRRRLPLGRRLGSVAHAVLLHALCPIAVVPGQATAATGEPGADTRA
ncbi:universal stress protein [Streptomyces sp. NPDC059080]|uniref:universal stress protein n=1 Tax=Streptomyces sp. NPDC059080 TaxID=3346718 RepID=UPI0036A17087